MSAVLPPMPRASAARAPAMPEEAAPPLPPAGGGWAATDPEAGVVR